MLSLVLGVLYAAVNPPFAVNDERRHLGRARELSSGRLLTGGPQGGFRQASRVPEGYWHLIKRYEDLAFNSKDRVVLPVLFDDLTTRSELTAPIWVQGGAGGYGPIPYVPAIVGIWIARFLHTPYLWHLYLARLSSLVACTILGAYAVKAAGRFKWPIAVFGLGPMFLTQAAGVDADALVDALGLVFFALLARSFDPKSSLSVRERHLLVLSVVLMALCKPIYAVMAFALLALPGSPGRPRWTGGIRPMLAAAGIAGAGALSWSWLSRETQSIYKWDPGAQLGWLLAHKSEIPGIVGSTLLRSGRQLILQGVAGRDTIVRDMGLVSHFAAFTFILVLIAVSSGVLRGVVPPGWSRHWRATWLAVQWLGVAAGVMLAMYLTFTPLGAGSIRGIHGRYFLPAVPGLLLILAMYGRPTLARWLTQKGGRWVLIAVVGVNVVILSTLIGRYYASPKLPWLF